MTLSKNDEHKWSTQINLCNKEYAYLGEAVRRLKWTVTLDPRNTRSRPRGLLRIRMLRSFPGRSWFNPRPLLTTIRAIITMPTLIPARAPRHSQVKVGNQALVYLFDSIGNFEKTTISRSTLVSKSMLSARDLRYVDGTYAHIPTILPRDSSIVICLEHIHAIIQSDSVMLWDIERPAVSHFAETLAESIRNRQKEESYSLPFELHCLEHVLSAVCDAFETNLETLSPVLHSVLKKLSVSTSEDILSRLLPLKTSLIDFENSVKEVGDVLSGLLAQDEDMVELYLTEKKKLGAMPPIEQHKEVELLLENYSRQLAEIGNEIAQLKQAIQSTQDVIMMNLDASRNRILRLNLHMAMVSTSLGCGAVAVGAFGMNLHHGFENSATAFYTTSGWILAGMAGIYTIFFLYYRSNRLEKRRISDYKAITSLRRNMKDLEMTLYRHVRATGRTSFTPTEFKHMLISAAGTLSKEQFDQIVRLCDADDDGKISYQEFLSILRRRRS